MKQIILGTAGHIDHGKTSLIRTVTGIDTDRLKEEKLRGITIELGFASLDLPSGQHIGIVDVPGHEKFVKNMVAGATGIDLVAMIIAADEGVMPQTREHMEICTLLGIKHGMVVLTKTDLVDQEWLELALEDVKDFMSGSFLEDSPIIPVSSINGQGIEDFIKALDDISSDIPERPVSSLFRLPVDRVFTMKGFGTVITGTLISGQVRVGEDIMIYPSQLTAKVRGIQVHNLAVNEALAGQRTAINFQGLEKSALQRGEVLSKPDALKPSYMVDLNVHFLTSNKKPLKNRTRVRFHTGTSEILGNLILLDREELEPGDTIAAQIRLDVPVTLVKDDRFVIRSYSPVQTIGGGKVINPIPTKHKRFKPDIAAMLESLARQDSPEIVDSHLKIIGSQGLSFKDLLIMTNLPEKQLNKLLQQLLSKKDIIQIDKENRVYIHHHSFEEIIAKATEHLHQYHQDYPLKAGMPKQELKSKFLPPLGTKLFNHLLQQMIKTNSIVQEGELIRKTTHKVSLKVDQADAKQKLLEIYSESSLTPPYFKELRNKIKIEADQAKDVLHLLIEEGLIVKVKEDLYFDAKAVAKLRQKLVDFLNHHNEINTPQFKEMAGISRKYLIPLAEYFDSKNVTIRIGDVRKLRGG